MKTGKGSLNQLNLIGRLGQDPELKQTQSGTAFCKFSVATTSGRKDQSGKWNEETTWHNVTAWSKTAEIVGKYLKKGSQVMLDCHLTNESWTDKNGNKRSAVGIMVDNLVMLGSPGNGKQAQNEPGVEFDSGTEEDDLPF